MTKYFFSMALVLLGLGCSTTVKYPPYGQWTPDTKTLGTVTANSGFWPLSLNSMPHEQTFYSALREQAAKMYGVNKNNVVLGEVTVKVGAEMVGTIRDWKANAEAGYSTNAPATGPSR